ncbi:MAG TPA: hypothetical protein VMR52_12765 [Dehalococcoidia bacterium]|nr:hypothetical protein [Dehalococcoidia bacterium]
MPQRSDRIQREVEELLTKLEQFPPKKPLVRHIGDVVTAPFRALGRVFSGIRLPRINAGHILLGAIILIVVAWVAGDASGLWTWVIALGVLGFILAFVLSLRRQSRPPAQKYWRDRPMDVNDRSDGKSLWDRWRGR